VCQVLRRALRGLVYPKLLAELLEAAMREAQAELRPRSRGSTSGKEWCVYEERVD